MPFSHAQFEPTPAFPQLHTMPAVHHQCWKAHKQISLNAQLLTAANPTRSWLFPLCISNIYYVGKYKQFKWCISAAENKMSFSDLSENATGFGNINSTLLLVTVASNTHPIHLTAWRLRDILFLILLPLHSAAKMTKGGQLNATGIFMEYKATAFTRS